MLLTQQKRRTKRQRPDAHTTPPPPSRGAVFSFVGVEGLEGRVMGWGCRVPIPPPKQGHAANPQPAPRVRPKVGAGSQPSNIFKTTTIFLKPQPQPAPWLPTPHLCRKAKNQTCQEKKRNPTHEKTTHDSARTRTLPVAGLSPHLNDALLKEAAGALLGRLEAEAAGGRAADARVYVQARGETIGLNWGCFVWGGEKAFSRGEGRGRARLRAGERGNERLNWGRVLRPCSGGRVGGGGATCARSFACHSFGCRSIPGGRKKGAAPPWRLPGP